MDMIKMLPQEIENKIFYMIAEHPLATIFKKHVDIAVKSNDAYPHMFIKYKDYVRSRVLVDVDDKEQTEFIDYLMISQRAVESDNPYSRYDAVSFYYCRFYINSMLIGSIEDYARMLKMFKYKII